MALDTRFIPAFYFQETLRDKTTGDPLSAGIVTFYKDQARTELKAVYRISGSPPNYSYDPLPNPLTLSSIGTFEDSSGNDVAVYFFPYDSAPANPTGNLELYYITVENSGAQLQFTREGQPNLGDGETIDSLNDDNFILNAQYRLFKEETITPTTMDLYHIAYLWDFQKSTTSSTDTITIEDFPQSIAVEGTPTYFVQYNCTAGGAGDTYKDFIYTIPDVNSFEQETIRFSLFGRETSGKAVTVHFVQNFGTGGSGTVEEQMGELDFSSSFTKLTTASYTPLSVSTKTIGEGNYIQIRIRMPLNTTATVGFTNAQLNIGADIYEFKQLEYNRNVANTIGSLLPVPKKEDYYSKLVWDGEQFILDAETGRLSFGFESARSGTLYCDGAAYRSIDFITGTDDRLTYERLWQWLEDNTQSGNLFGYGDNGFLRAAKYSNSTVMFTTKLKTAITAWTPNTSGFTITQNMAGIAGGFDYTVTKSFNSLIDESTLLLADQYVEYARNYQIQLVNDVVGAVAAPTTGTMPGSFTIQSIHTGAGATPQTLVLSFNLSPVEIAALGGKYFTVSSTTTNTYIWFRVDGVGVDPAPGGTGIVVDIDSTNITLGGQVSELVYYLMNGASSTTIDFVAAASITPGTYFTAYNDSENYAFYYVIDGTGSEPTVPTADGIISVEILGSDTNAQVMEKSQKIIRSVYFQVPDLRGLGLRGTDNGRGVDPDAAERHVSGDLIAGDNAGTLQRDDFKSHAHRISKDAGGAGHGSLINNTPSATFLNTTFTGNNETRMVNINANFFINF